MESQTHGETEKPIDNEGNQQAEQKQTPTKETIILSPIRRVTTNTPALFSNPPASQDGKLIEFM